MARITGTEPRVVTKIRIAGQDDRAVVSGCVDEDVLRGRQRRDHRHRIQRGALQPEDIASDHVRGRGLNRQLQQRDHRDLHPRCTRDRARAEAERDSERQQHGRDRHSRDQLEGCVDRGWQAEAGQRQEEAEQGAQQQGIGQGAKNHPGC